MAPDLFSGWGVRSLSERHPSYNPLAYHLGTVWPIEQATFAVGFKRYGFDDHLDRLVEGLLCAAADSSDGRLPEALTGHARGAVPAPIAYPEACSPQAWSASALIQTVQATLGIYPFAPLGILGVVRPRLPAWLPEVTVGGIRVGRAVVDLRFSRRADGSARWRVVGLRGPLLVVPVAPPNEERSRRGLDGLGSSLIDHLPGRLGHALRISLGVNQEARAGQGDRHG
jgi:hypothetical protein